MPEVAKMTTLSDRSGAGYELVGGCLWLPWKEPVSSANWAPTDGDRMLTCFPVTPQL